MKIRRTLHALLGWSLVVGAAVVAVPGAPSVVHAAGLGGGGEYHALTPTRIFDSRTANSLNDVAPIGKKPTTPGAGSGFDIQVTGLGGVPNDGTVLAVVASITVVGPTREGFLGAYPAGSPSTNSIINFKAGQTMPNLTILRPGNGGKVSIVLSSSPTAGTADVFVDVSGYFTTSSGARGARLVPVGNPGRIFDRRGAQSLGAGQQATVPIRGADTVDNSQTDIVPNDGDVVGVLVNITATEITGNTFISAVPDTPVGPPATSNVNVLPGQTKANMALVPVGSDGAIHLYNDQGTAGIILDVMGYLLANEPEGTRAGRVVPLDSPFRVFDTRQPPWGQAAIGPGQAEDWSFADFVAHVNIGATWVGNQSALIGNLTIAEAKRQYPTVPVNGGYLTAYPSTASRPLISNLNSVEGASVPNLALMRYGTNSVVRIYNSLGYTHYILDVSAVVLAD